MGTVAYCGEWTTDIDAPVFYAPSHGNIHFNTGEETLNIAFLDVGCLTGRVVPQTSEVFVNGTEEKMQNGPFNLSLSPGQYTVLAETRGYTSYGQNVTVIFGSVSYDNIDLNKVPTSALSLGSPLGQALAFAGVSPITAIVLILYKRLNC